MFLHFAGSLRRQAVMDVQAVFQSPARWGLGAAASDESELHPREDTHLPDGGGRRAAAAAADTVPRCLPPGIASLQIDVGIAALATTVTIVCRQC